MKTGISSRHLLMGVFAGLWDVVHGANAVRAEGSVDGRAAHTADEIQPAGTTTRAISDRFHRAPLQPARAIVPSPPRVHVGVCGCGIGGVESVVDRPADQVMHLS